MIAIVLAGALAGAGVLLLVVAYSRPAMRGVGAPATLAALDAERQKQAQNAPAENAGGAGAASGRAGVTSSVGRGIRRQLELSGIRLPAGLRADLSLIDRPIENHLAYSLLGAALGAVVPFVLGGLLVGLVGGLPVTTPVFLGISGLVIGAMLPTLQAGQRATVRRRDFRHVVGSFLDLVALNLSGGRGVPEALNSAASVSDGWAMVRLRDTLAIARLQGVTPWSALSRLGEETAVAELSDLGAALELVADDGAKVRESLAARAASMRRREMADAEGRAQARSQSMLIAQLLLAVGFLIFLIYPAIVRVLSGT
ncbi:type II secretion system F family protein [Kineosporia sp. J2-2]|uniref:Type II secretion system F family protein n=1 Tax=Kineosporia corallincola TaxID=2835133 RepID=A0ABS5TMM2_9ACTN|nr:type II secretion system F family protein [Kineosporia corallincola]MBT0772255.1 type II secretion system F family protein [Kineosporia corallincola]